MTKHKNKGRLKRAFQRKKREACERLSIKSILQNRQMHFLFLSFLLIYVIRVGLGDWILLYLTESKHYTYLQGASAVTWFEVGGFMGSLLAGLLSDYLFSGRRGPLNIFYALGATITLYFLWVYPGDNYFWDATLIFFSGFFVFGPQLLIGMAAAEVAGKDAAGTATGMAGLFGYAGAALAGGPLGLVIDKL